MDELHLDELHLGELHLGEFGLDEQLLDPFDLQHCMLCPRSCGVNRLSNERGFCNEGSEIQAARAALHFYEEPCISGTRGSGAVFFSGCNLRCVFCQNREISTGRAQKPLRAGQLSDIFLRLQEEGAHNINLVTAIHFLPQVISALNLARAQGLGIPIVYNTSGYETVESLKKLEGLIDIYLPDCKYVSSLLSKKYSGAGDYFAYCKEALREMVRQTGPPLFTDRQERRPDQESASNERFLTAKAYNDLTSYEGPLMRRGVIVRHLCLPGNKEDSKRVIRYLYETFGDQIYLSIMNQYTPMPSLSSVQKQYPELLRKLPERDYEEIVDFALSLGVENAFIQEGDTAQETFIPAFDFTGLE